MISITKYENLAMSLVWKFQQGNPHLDRKDLYQEAALAFIFASRKFDPTRGTKFTTYAYQAMQRRLIDFAKANVKKANVEVPERGHTPYTYFEMYDSLTKPAQQIVDMIILNREKFIGRTQHDAKAILRGLMAEKHMKQKVKFKKDTGKRYEIDLFKEIKIALTN